MEVLVGVVVVAAMGLVAYWKREETRVAQAQLAAQNELNEKLVAQYGDLTEKLQKPWGDPPATESDTLDLIAQLDEEWLNAPESLVEFDDDLRALEEE